MEIDLSYLPRMTRRQLEDEAARQIRNRMERGEELSARLGAARMVLRRLEKADANTDFAALLADLRDAVDTRRAISRFRVEIEVRR